MIATMKKNNYIQPNTTVITIAGRSSMMQQVSNLTIDNHGGGSTNPGPTIGGESDGGDFSKGFGGDSLWED